MRSEEFQIVSSDGTELFGQSWHPEGEQEPTSVICIHGFAEHSGRYEHVGKFFTDNNISVYAMDVRGHGHSPGKRGHIGNYEQLIDDVEELLKIARRDHNDSQLFLYGHSFGGGLVANYLTARNSSEIAGGIISSPWLKLAFDPPAFKLKLAGIMQKIYARFSEKTTIEGHQLSKDEQVGIDYFKDPLVHGQVTAGSFFQIVQFGEKVIAEAMKLTIPVRLFHGTDDTITSIEASRAFANNSSKVELTEYEGVRHEPHNDLEQNVVLADTLEWVKNKEKINR